METIIEWIKEPRSWLIVGALYFIFYAIRSKLIFINVTGIFKNYRRVFEKSTHSFYFFIFFPGILGIASTLNSVITETISSVIGVILSLLTSMALTFMSMTNERYLSSQTKGERDRSNERLQYQNKDALAVGMYEIFWSILVLILIFSLPIFYEEALISYGISFFIYYGFYSFLLNIFIMVRRLYQTLS